VAAVARIAVIGTPNLTSTDAIRYLWDGRVVLAGADPWSVPPNDPRLADLAVAWPFPRVHASLATVYPPGAIALFAIAAMAGARYAPIVWDILLFGAAIGTVLLAARISRRHVALVALSPLLVLETGVGRHVDTFAAFAVAAALSCHRRSAPVRAGIALAAGALIKPVCFAVFPALVAAAEPGRARRRVIATTAGLTAAIYLIAMAARFRPVGSLPAFLSGWRFGAPPFAAVSAVSSEAAAWIVSGAIGVVGLVASVSLARHGDLGRAVCVALGSAFAASPVVFPWYLMVAVPAVALAPSATMLAWLSAIPFTYEVERTAATAGTWSPAGWPLYVMSLAVGVGALIDASRGGSRFAGSEARSHRPCRVGDLVTRRGSRGRGTAEHDASVIETRSWGRARRQTD
jgi:hypothetical protein